MRYILLAAVFGLVGCDNRQESARKDLAKIGKDFSPAIFRASVRDGDEMAIRLFVEAGMDVNKPDENGFTPLMIASWNGNAKGVQLLAEKGANLNAVSSGGRTALQLAKERHNRDVVRILSNFGAKDLNRINLDFAVAVINNMTNEVKLLISQGANPNIRFSDIELADSDRPHMIEIMHAHTPLTTAVQGGQEEVVKLLLQHGADPILQNANGQSPLSLARDKNLKKIEQLLLKAAEDRSRQ